MTAIIDIYIYIDFYDIFSFFSGSAFQFLYKKLIEIQSLKISVIKMVEEYSFN